MTGKFPMLETPEGNLNESVAIAKYLAHGHATLLGTNHVERAQIDQWCLWALGALSEQWPAIRAIHGWAEVTKDEYTVSANATKASAKTLNGALTGDWLVGSNPTVADFIAASFFLVSAQTFLDAGFRKAMPKFGAWLARVFALPAYVSVAGHVKLAAKAVAPQIKVEVKKEEVKKAAPAKKEAAEDEDGNPIEEKKAPNPLDLLPPSTFDLFNFKTFFVNHKDKSGEAIDEMLKIYDPAGYSIWFLHYDKYKGEGEVLYKTENLSKGFLQRFDQFRKHAFARHIVLGEEPSLEIEGVWLFRGTTIPQEAIDHPQFEYYKQRRMDLNDPADVALLRAFWGAKEGEMVNGMKAQSVMWHK